MEIKGHDIAFVSFPDFAVLSWQIDAAARNMVVTTDGACLDEDGGHTFIRAELSFSNWISLRLRCFDTQAEKWQKCNYDYDKLADICEFDVSAEAITLRGFGRSTGLWIEIEIRGGTAAIELT